MESLVRLIVAAFELVEAEGRMLRDQLVRIAIAMALGVIIVILAMTGIGFLLFSLFQFLARPLTPAGAAAVFGVVALLLAAIGGATIRQLLASRGHHEPHDH